MCVSVLGWAEDLANCCGVNIEHSHCLIAPIHLHLAVHSTLSLSPTDHIYMHIMSFAVYYTTRIR